MDPILFLRLGQIRQQEILEQAACDRERPIVIQWSRMFEPVQAFLQRRSRSRRMAFQSSAMLTQPALEECPCE